MIKLVNSAARAILGGLFPQQCVLCAMPSHREVPLCLPCEADLQVNASCCRRCAVPLTTAADLCGACLRRPPAFDRVVAPWLYDDLLGHIIRRWKFHRDLRLTRLLARLWLQACPAPGAVDLMAPVPLHWRRRWQRGYNQSELLCHQLRKEGRQLAAIPADYRLLRRTRATAPQSGMSAAERAVNLRDAFTACRPCDNLSIAVVDDVLTTGATGTAVARALREAGARHVEFWCLARTPRARGPT